MSAFICSQKHINTLVNKLIDYDLLVYMPKEVERNGQAVADMLFKENLRSILYRYPDDKAEEYTPVRFVRQSISLPAIAIVKLCNCYDYQACETDDYDQSAAAKCIRHIRSRAISQIPGYDEADWAVN